MTLESYAEVKPPENFEAPPEQVDGYKKWALEQGLSVSQAQAALDFHLSDLQTLKDSLLESSKPTFTQQVKEWETQTYALPEFQGEGKAHSTAIIGRMIDEFGTPDLRKAMDATGAGSHPAFVQFVLNMANVLTEGEPINPGGQSLRPRVAAPSGKSCTLLNPHSKEPPSNGHRYPHPHDLLRVGASPRPGW